MRTRYTVLGHALRRAYRRLRPIAPSPAYEPDCDICSVRLVPPGPLTRAFRRAIRRLDPGPGEAAYVEFGIFNGTSLTCMVQASRAEGMPLRMVGLDSFEGLPQRVAAEDSGVWLPGQFACPRNRTEECLERAGIAPGEVELLGGWYDEIPPDELGRALAGRRASIVMIDCDAYSSAVRALALVTPFLAPQAIIFFDDWRLRDVDLLGGGEYRAFNEWRESNSRWQVKRFKSYSRKSEAFILSYR